MVLLVLSVLNCSVKQRTVAADKGRGKTSLYTLYILLSSAGYADEISEEDDKLQLYLSTLENICYLCIGCRIGNLLLVAFRLLFCEVKRPKFNKQTNNRHIKCSRRLAWVCLCLYGYLVVPSSR